MQPTVTAPSGELEDRALRLSEFRERLTVGAGFTYVGYYANGKPQPGFMWDTNLERWVVMKVVERGVVVAHRNGGHEHLLEWDKPLVKIKFAPPGYLPPW